MSYTEGKTTRAKLMEWAFWHKERDNLIREGVEKGMSGCQIADYMQISPDTVVRSMRSQGLDHYIRNKDRNGNPIDYRRLHTKALAFYLAHHPEERVKAAK